MAHSRAFLGSRPKHGLLVKHCVSEVGSLHEVTGISLRKQALNPKIGPCKKASLNDREGHPGLDAHDAFLLRFAPPAYTSGPKPNFLFIFVRALLR